MPFIHGEKKCPLSTVLLEFISSTLVSLLIMSHGNKVVFHDIQVRQLGMEVRQLASVRPITVLNGNSGSAGIFK